MISTMLLLICAGIFLVYVAYLIINILDKKEVKNGTDKTRTAESGIDPAMRLPG